MALEAGRPGAGRSSPGPIPETLPPAAGDQRAQSPPTPLAPLPLLSHELPCAAVRTCSKLEVRAVSCRGQNASTERVSHLCLDLQSRRADLDRCVPACVIASKWPLLRAFGTVADAAGRACRQALAGM
jgi:hypothetical protein